MRPSDLRTIAAMTLALGAVTLRASTASASGTIYAVVTLTNETSQCISIPFSGASTSSAWGTTGYTPQVYPDSETMTDGTPPRILAPGQTMLWGTKSNGGPLSTSGTGGSLSIPLNGQTATMTWSVPWSYFNGLGGSASGSPSVSNSGGFAPPEPFGLVGGVQSCGDNTCLFQYGLTGGPSSTQPASGLGSGQCMSLATECPAGMNCSQAISSITSSDGSTTLSMNQSAPLSGTPPFGGQITLFDKNTDALWLAGVSTAAVLQMGTDGNLVAYDTGANVVWSSGTSQSGGFLKVTASAMSLVTAQRECFPIGRFFECGVYDVPYWTVDATTAPLQ